MQYATLTSINKRVSRLVYGTNSAVCSPDPEIVFDCLDKAWAHGFTVFDTANAYGRSEENIGLWMDKRGLRDQVVLLDKGCNPGMHGSPDIMSPQLLYDQTAESCRRLRTDYLDLYVLHRDDPTHPVGPIIDTLNDLKARGVIHRFGASNWTRERIAEANAYAAEHDMEGFTAVSPAFNLAEIVEDPWGGSVSLCGASHRADREWYLTNNIPVLPYSSLGRGFFSGKFRTDGSAPIEQCISQGSIWEYDCPVNRRRLSAAEAVARSRGASVSQIAIAWLMSQPLEVFPIVSPSTEAHMTENIGGLHLELTPEELRLLACE